MMHPISGLNGSPTANDTTERADYSTLVQVARALGTAKAPVVLVGRGVVASQTSNDLLRLAELLPHAVFASTPSAKGTFPEDHLQSVGVFGFGGHNAARTSIHSADVLVILGTQLLEQSSDGWSPLLNAPLVFRFDIDATRLTWQWPTQRAVNGNLAATLPGLITALEQHPPEPNARPESAQLRPAAVPQYTGNDSDDRHLKPQALLSALNRIATHVPVCADAGNSMCWAIEWLRRKQPNTFHVSLDWGSMGFALPAAIGTSLAKSTHVIALTGDGSMAMAGGELHTAVEYALPIVVIVLNDRSSGMVRMGMDLWFGEHDSVPGLGYRHCMNFAMFARSLGANGVCITDLETFELEVLKALNHPGPTLLDVHIDPTEVPNALSSRVESLRAQPQVPAGGGIC